jgi:hypothetical protein
MESNFTDQELHDAALGYRPASIRTRQLAGELLTTRMELARLKEAARWVPVEERLPRASHCSDKKSHPLYLVISRGVLLPYFCRYVREWKLETRSWEKYWIDDKCNRVYCITHYLPEISLPLPPAPVEGK